MKAYLDSSAVLRCLLGQPKAIQGWGDWQEAHSSELIRIEALRTLNRLSLANRLDDQEVAEKMFQFNELLETTNLIALDKAILERASQSLPTILGS